MNEKTKIHAGCGTIYMDGFFNIDIREDVKTDFCGSIFDAPIAKDSADFIWSSHMLEHLEYPKYCIGALKLFYLWLKDGGTLRLGLPDLNKVAMYYLEGKTELFKIFGNSPDVYYKFEDSRAERFHFFMTGWEHKIVFDFNLIKKCLESVGFSVVQQMGFNQSNYAQPWYNDRFEMESFYVEAVK